MQVSLAVGLALCLLTQCAGAVAVTRPEVWFGPESCVKLTRSAEGSCVITTVCKGLDTSKTEFAFNCISRGGGVVRHSFGLGGFDGNEEYDTEVKCDRCDVAASQVEKQPEAPKANLTKPVNITTNATAGVHSERAKSSGMPAAAKGFAGHPLVRAIFSPRTSHETVRYGPYGCVSVYKDQGGHCIMSTECKNVDIANYEFGLVCVDKVGSPVKHLFGTGSFDPSETFNTLIECDQCLGLEKLPDAVTIVGEVATMRKDIDNLKAVMGNISQNVKMLNTEVFPPTAIPVAPPAPAPAPAVAPPKEGKKALLHKRSSRKNLRRHRQHRHRHHRRKDEDDDDRDDLD